MTRESDADFGQTVRHSKGVAALVVAIVLATVGVISAAYGMAQSAASNAAERTFASEENRERMQNVADAAVEKRVAAPMARMEVEVRQLREVLQRVETYTRPAPAPRPRTLRTRTDVRVSP